MLGCLWPADYNLSSVKRLIARPPSEVLGTLRLGLGRGYHCPTGGSRGNKDIGAPAARLLEPQWSSWTRRSNVAACRMCKCRSS
jgi:hypothetical protein